MIYIYIQAKKPGIDHQSWEYDQQKRQSIYNQKHCLQPLICDHESGDKPNKFNLHPVDIFRHNISQTNFGHGKILQLFLELYCKPSNNFGSAIRRDLRDVVERGRKMVACSFLNQSFSPIVVDIGLYTNGYHCPACSFEKTTFLKSQIGNPVPQTYHDGWSLWYWVYSLVNCYITMEHHHF